jgi:carbonic anhydrase/acetyltransferase-like protein (isoleucine patch superfamily)
MPIYELDGIAPRFDERGSAWIAPDATLVGRIRIGRDVSIWFGAVLRGDIEEISIGAGSNIQEHSMLHTDSGFPLTVGDHCTIGHRAILHGCTVGDGALIGMGAIVLNGARIGRNCLVGAGALVTEGKEFPDNSLILGAPAKVVRVLDEDALRGLRASAENYVRNGQRFRTGMKEVGE